jgi:hypothetical protein
MPNNNKNCMVRALNSSCSYYFTITKLEGGDVWAV